MREIYNSTPIQMKASLRDMIARGKSRNERAPTKTAVNGTRLPFGMIKSIHTLVSTATGKPQVSA